MPEHPELPLVHAGLPDAEVNRFPYEKGAVLLVQKPFGWTSFDVVNKLRWHLNVKKLGHAGTLDPYATGLLVLGCGKMTKQLDYLQAGIKEYWAEVTLGLTAPSDDLETPTEASGDPSGISAEQIARALKQFEGEILQTPPVFSALRGDGKRAYQSARKGKAVKLEPRPVTIHQLQVVQQDGPRLTLRVVCGKGTYIRSLARELGEALGCGGVLSALQRSGSGDFTLPQAFRLPDLLFLTRGRRPQTQPHR